MKRDLLLLLVSSMMAFIGAGCSEDDFGFKITDDKIEYSDGSVVKYSPRDLKDYPDFLNVGEWDATDDFGSWHGGCIWTGILDGTRYYGQYNSLCSQAWGYVYTETGEYVVLGFRDNWTDVEIIYIHPQYIKYCRENKCRLMISYPG